HLRVVAGAARYPREGAAGCAAGSLQGFHQLRVHARGRDRGADRGARPAALLGADLPQARLEGVEDTVDDRSLQVADLQVELGATWYHVDPARIEPDGADGGHGVRVDALHQLAQAGDG